MSGHLAILYSCALSGLQAPTVCVEVHLSTGLPAFHMVGLPDTGVRESKERVRAAIEFGGWDFPAGRFTVNLSPTNLPKESGRFDLPIAVGILMATGQLVLPNELQQQLPHIYLMGELSLTGALISIQAPLIMALSIYKRDPKAIVIMPKEDAKVAARIRGLQVIGAETLAEVVAYLSGQRTIQEMLMGQEGESIDEASRGVESTSLCLSDIRGQAQACKALEIAASGGHGLILVGSPGVGKSMLAYRLPTLLPPLDEQQQLDVMAIYSLTKLMPPPLGIAPFRAPHHSASVVALIGGGANVLPGEISLANHGVLFLDEMAEFDRRVLEALREPLESGEIHIARVKRTQTYPARFQLIATCNPCPCGYLGHSQKLCRCTSDQITRYQNKLSGPLLERIDMHFNVHAITQDWLQAVPAERSEVVRARVEQCRQRQIQRQGVLNAMLSDAQVKAVCTLDKSGESLLSGAMQRLAWSARVSQRLLKVARTIADMSEHEMILEEDLAQAMMFRGGSGG
ncbi:YifB family Mg chelatase-like AAA ATPase [Pelistega suis]|uniref:YifB family Mg chelatase-like AAA ATPase n=1 Tax=Pelistega suis TaxID=1631957 RepID=A0A849P9L9_9BURK|nr:YifB family Mg chelatase-like AAA ATPase [Pelistega suis]NOL51627.1 YifB family Mg chelatase-like AAA ATPase [Pelistega suis]